MGLCDPKQYDVNYLVKTEPHMFVAIIMCVLYLIALIFCIYSSYRAIRDITIKEDFLLVPYVGTLNCTLLIRIFYFLAGISPFCYPVYWNDFFDDIANLSKDIALISLLCRVWDYLDSLEGEEKEFKQRSQLTYIFMGTHFFVGYILILVVDSQLTYDFFSIYLGGVQIILFFVFIYAFFKLYSTMKQNPDRQYTREVSLMNILSIIVIFTLLVRIIYELAIEASDIGEMYLPAVIYTFDLVSELTPCVLMTLILFFQQRNLLASVLSGSSVAESVLKY